LNDLPPANLVATASESPGKGTRRITARIGNPTNSVALAIRLKVQRAKSGERVLPVTYTDNYFSLLPGERRTILLEFPDGSLNGELPRLIAEGWNIPAREIVIDEPKSNQRPAPHAAGQF